MPEQIPKEVVQHRFDRLVALQEKISHEINVRQVGQVFEVLVEGLSKKDSKKVTGRTRTNKLVHFSDSAREGEFRDVRITRAAPHHLEGEAVAGRSGA
jgi:tRNA-2-methylthio-N6-dimethylallyladenosine synthase